MPPSGLGHYAVVGIQEPPLLPAVFCQPIAIGGPGGAELDFPAWPILVPTNDGIQVCFTPDEEFRNTYLHQGFCGLDASFRDKFDYNCSAPIIHVTPSVGEEKQDGGVGEDEPSDADPEQQDEKQDDNKEVTPWSILGYLLAPALRICAGVWYVLSSCAKFIWEFLVETCELFFTGVLYVLSFLFLCFLGTGALTAVIWCVGLVFHWVGLGSHPRDWENKGKRTDDEPRAGDESRENAEPGPDNGPRADDEPKPDNQQTAVNPLTADNLQRVNNKPGPDNRLKPNNKPKASNQPTMSGSSLWGQAAPATRTHVPVSHASPPHLYPAPSSSLPYPSGPSYPSYAAQLSNYPSYSIPPLLSAQRRRPGSEYDTDDSAGLTTPSSRGSQFPQHHQGFC